MNVRKIAEGMFFFRAECSRKKRSLRSRSTEKNWERKSSSPFLSGKKNMGAFRERRRETKKMHVEKGSTSGGVLLRNLSRPERKIQ